MFLAVTSDNLLCDGIILSKVALEKDIALLPENCDAYEIRVIKDMRKPQNPLCKKTYIFERFCTNGITNNTDSSMSTIDGYSFTEFKEWYEQFKSQSKELVAQGIWTQAFSQKMQARYNDIISEIENDNGKVFGHSPEGSNEVVNNFYDTEHLIFQVPEEISEMDMNSPKWIVKIFPVK